MKVVITITGADGGGERKPRPGPRARRKRAGGKKFTARLGVRKSRFAKAAALSKDGGVADAKMTGPGKGPAA
jgi:hypothetical protein